MNAQRIVSMGFPGWQHDEGRPSGIFHTYDALNLGDGGRKVHVFLPRTIQGPLPVAYMHDGDTALWPGGVAGQTWDAAGVLDRMGASRPGLMLVAIHSPDRNAEYTHADWAQGQRPWGHLPLYTAYLADRLKPFIDAAYPTRPEPRHTAVIGSSHGGLASFWQATRRPDRFGFAGCLSPSFFTGIDRLEPDGARPVALADAPLLTPVASLLADVQRRPRLWLDWGLVRTGGRHNAVVEALATARGREMAALLTDVYGYTRQSLSPGEAPSAAELWVQEDPHGEHSERSWQRRLPGVLRAFASGWS